MRIEMSRTTPQSNGINCRWLRMRSSRWRRTPRDSQFNLKNCTHTRTCTHFPSMRDADSSQMCTLSFPFSLFSTTTKKSLISSFFKTQRLKALAKVGPACLLCVCALYKQHDTCVFRWKQGGKKDATRGMKWIRLNFSKTILFEFSRLQEKSWGIVQVSVQPMLCPFCDVVATAT